MKRLRRWERWVFWVYTAASWGVTVEAMPCPQDPSLVRLTVGHGRNIPQGQWASLKVQPSDLARLVRTPLDGRWQLVGLRSGLGALVGERLDGQGPQTIPLCVGDPKPQKAKRDRAPVPWPKPLRPVVLPGW